MKTIFNRPNWLSEAHDRRHAQEARRQAWRAFRADFLPSARTMLLATVIGLALGLALARYEFCLHQFPKP